MSHSRRRPKVSGAQVRLPPLMTVAEIVVIHSTRITAELLRRNDSGNWPPDPIMIEDTSLRLESIGAVLSLADVYAGTHLIGSAAEPSGATRLAT